MVERICPRCDRDNPSDHTYCGHCGVALEQSLAQRVPSALARRTAQLPVQWKQAGKVVALGVATVAVEAGLALLQRRQQGIVKAQPNVQRARVIAVGRRVTETWYGGQLQHRTDEQVMWFQSETPPR